MCKIPHRQFAGHQCKNIIINGHSVLTRMNAHVNHDIWTVDHIGPDKYDAGKAPLMCSFKPEHEIEGNNARAVPIV